MKKNLLILFGGRSSEHEVSCVSASYVIENADIELFNILPVGITREGSWFLYKGEASEIRDGRWISDTNNLIPVRLAPKSPPPTLTLLHNNGRIEEIILDVAFPVLHGTFGEDGTVQGLFELCSLPYVGAGVAASAMAIDKVLAKILFENAGLKQADWIWDYVESDPTPLIAQVEEKLSYPVFVKPSRCGSSVGISKAKNRDELEEAIINAAHYDHKIVVEAFVQGKEIECAVLGNINPKASVCGEIVPAKEFYDYDAKYNDIGSITLVPAPISDEKMDEIRTCAVLAYKTLCCTGLSRADFFLTADDKVLINEINTMPGFTQISMYPKLWHASGIFYKELISELINLALERSGEAIRYE